MPNIKKVKKPNKKPSIKWLDLPEEHNYPAAFSVLSLIMIDSSANEVIERLKKSDVVHFKAKDIFRLSKESLLGISNSHVLKDQAKIEEGKKLSPLILYRERTLGRVLIADGYHRLCAVYHYDEDALIPCKIH